MRIAHLSDIHLCATFKKANIGKTKKLIKLALEKGADHFVFTGDISDNSDEKDFLIFRKILESFDLLHREKTTLVIGNHDIFGGVQTAQDILNFPAKCLSTNYDKKVNEFVGYFNELFENCFFPVTNKPFPYAKIIGDVVYIGLNTSDYYSRIKNSFASNGKVHKEQFEGIKKILEMEKFKSKKKIILSHHHFYKNSEEATSSNLMWTKIESYTLKLRGKKKLLKLFKKNNVELVLHGHSHEMREYERKGIKFLNAGGSVDNSNSNKSSIVLIDIGEKISPMIYELTTEASKEKKILSIAENPPSVFC
jgi:3',5'-cyclic AMP phosphodiesterase CpdA